MLTFLFALFSISESTAATDGNADSLYIASHYNKQEVMITMRDGVKLFTQIYAPKDASEKYPILLKRTPYSCQPYGNDGFRKDLGPDSLFIREKYIFVYQDVRGRFMSEGTYVNMRPQIDQKKKKTDIDESSDTWDTIDWLVQNVSNNNGKVGMYGISYPGFYTAVGSIDSHPALKAVSPQAPIADWFWDDFHHHGAFFLPHAFGFFSFFGKPRPQPTKVWPARFDYGTPDGYHFYLDKLGALSQVNPKFYHDSIAFWNEMAAHPNYDTFWQSRNLLPHLKNIRCAVLTVGGLFDAEDLYGSFKIYGQIEKDNPGISNRVVIGPWRHGGWVRDDGTHLGNVAFGDSLPASRYYQEQIEFPFFQYHLKGKGNSDLAEATVFETGTNKWRKFDSWPPKGIVQKKLYLHPGHRMNFTADASQTSDSFISDPAHPVPFTETIYTGMTREYMTDDQRFASKRSDVLTYQTDILDEDVTLAGPILAHLLVSTSQSDADWVVKLIDVYPDDAPDNAYMQDRLHMGGYQQMVRSEVIRGRFRNSYSVPEPFQPDQPAEVKLPLMDVMHTFRKGHRIMVQIQSTWFPLVDRNPQKYVPNIFEATENDFVPATHKLYMGTESGTFLEVGVLRNP
ncbi:MAG: CocE/NonD family hydrolase [Flavobacteriales bacterium]|nr:CocE/NonD family hydrolase [Flavobacteriales bacterium]MCB9449079.1 CocE/NonD family hydrolase [Flavobacteriales bacterium]